jgi:hypothetical protein
MFRRLILEQWASVIAVISFCFFFVVFAYATLRALRMAEKSRNHLASLPLDTPDERASSLQSHQ